MGESFSIVVIQFKLAQLQLQFGQIRGVVGQELCVDQCSSFFFLACESRSSSVRSTMDVVRGDLVNFVRNRSLAVKRGYVCLTVADDC